MKIALCLPGGGAMGAHVSRSARWPRSRTPSRASTPTRSTSTWAARRARAWRRRWPAGLPVQRHVPRVPRSGGRLLRARAQAPAAHRLWPNGGARCCRRCRRSATRASSRFRARRKPCRPRLWQELDRLYDSLPAGLFTLEGYEQFLEEFFVRRGVPNAFSAMPRPLRMLAHDLDSGAPVASVVRASTSVPLARACIASMAVPPFFSPVRVGDRQYINPGVGDALAAGSRGPRGRECDRRRKLDGAGLGERRCRRATAIATACVTRA